MVSRYQVHFTKDLPLTIFYSLEASENFHKTAMGKSQLAFPLFCLPLSQLVVTKGRQESITPFTLEENIKKYFYCKKIIPKSSEVIHSLPEQCHSKDKAQRPPVCVQVPNTDAGDELAECHHQEVQVQEETKLIK